MFINTVLHLENIIYRAEENIRTGLYQQFSSQPIYAAQDEGWGTTTEEQAQLGSSEQPWTRGSVKLVAAEEENMK